MRVPAADELFRATVVPDGSPDSERPTDAGASSATTDQMNEAVAEEQDADPVPDGDFTPSRKPSGRVRHDEKMTVYVTEDELLDIEHARLTLRRSQGIAIDRGRLVREAVALALADLETNGHDSAIVARLSQA